MENLPEITAAIAKFFDLEIVKAGFFVCSFWIVWIASEKQFSESKKDKLFQRIVFILFLLLLFICFASDALPEEYSHLFSFKEGTGFIALFIATIALWHHVKIRLCSAFGILLFYTIATMQFIRENIRDVFTDANLLCTITPLWNFLILFYIVLNLVYFLLFLYHLYSISNFKKQSLHNNKIFLIIYPIFSTILPLLVTNFFKQYLNTESEISVTREFFPFVFFMWNIPWFLYFTFSSTIRAIWAALESNSHENTKNTPPVVS